MANKEKARKDFFLIRWVKSFGGFVAAAYKELKKVSWPTRQELWKNTWVVLLVVAVLGAVVYLFDVGFSLIKGLLDGIVG
jgi:preprotein translocase subunit SecE